MLALPGGPATDDQRGLASSISFSNNTSYSTSVLLFPTVKDAAAANSMQVAEAVLMSSGTPLNSGTIAGGQAVPESATLGLLGLTVIGLALFRRRR